MPVQAQTRTSDILPDLTPVLRAQHVESVSVAVIRNGRIVSRGAWGMAAPNRPATIDTTYNLASLTKPLTAEVVLRMTSAGRLSLDDAMARCWSDPDLAQDPRRFVLTPRMALSHRSGFPNWRAESGLAFDHPPGEVWGYSGEGYQYVARYAAARSGQAFERLAQRWLFGPVRMRHTGYLTDQNAAGPEAVAFDGDGKPLPVTPVTRYNAADLAHATAEDYARFMVEVMQDRGLTPAIAAERNRSQADLTSMNCAGAKAAACPPWVGYGLGWQLLGFASGTVMMHTGKDPGVFTFAMIDRGRNDGVVILTNSDHGWRMILPVLEATQANPEVIAYLRAQMN